MFVDMWPIIIERLLTGLSADISYKNDRNDFRSRSELSAGIEENIIEVESDTLTLEIDLSES